MRVCVFGASGTVGEAITNGFVSNGWDVTCVSRTATWSASNGATRSPTGLSDYAGGAKYDAAIWAQGVNISDSILRFDRAEHERVYAANVTYVLETLSRLLQEECLGRDSKLCIVGSIWQWAGRPAKLSYTVSKAAVTGLVRALAADLAPMGVLVNAVSPGVIESPMTREMLSENQISLVKAGIPLRRMTSLDDVVGAALYLCGPGMSGITGQFLTVDGGWTSVRML